MNFVSKPMLGILNPVDSCGNRRIEMGANKEKSCKCVLVRISICWDILEGKGIAHMKKNCHCKVPEQDA